MYKFLSYDDKIMSRLVTSNLIYANEYRPPPPNAFAYDYKDENPVAQNTSTI